MRSTSRTTPRKTNRVESGGPQSRNEGLILVVNIDSIAEKGFMCSSLFEGRRIEIEFDDADEGLTLSRAMCERALLRRGSAVVVYVEDGGEISALNSSLKGIGDKIRFSDSKLYFLIGRLGGAILRITKA